MNELSELEQLHRAKYCVLPIKDYYRDFLLQKFIWIFDAWAGAWAGLDDDTIRFLAEAYSKCDQCGRTVAEMIHRSHLPRHRETTL